MMGSLVRILVVGVLGGFSVLWLLIAFVMFSEPDFLKLPGPAVASVVSLLVLGYLLGPPLVGRFARAGAWHFDLDFRWRVLRWIYQPAVGIWVLTAGVMIPLGVIEDDTEVWMAPILWGAPVLVAHLVRFGWWHARAKRLLAAFGEVGGLTIQEARARAGGSAFKSVVLAPPSGQRWIIAGEYAGATIEVGIRRGFAFAMGQLTFKVARSRRAERCVPLGLTLRAETLQQRLHKRAGYVADVVLGDPAYDSEVLMDRLSPAIAVLDAENRQRLVTFFAAYPTAVLMRGEVTYNRFRALNVPATFRVLDDLCALTDALAVLPDELHARLVKTILSEPVPAVALTQFDVLVDAAPKEAAALVPHLLPLLQEELPDEVRSRTITALASELARPDVCEAFTDALAGPPPAQVAACRAFMEHGPQAGRRAVLAQAAHFQDPEALVIAVRLVEDAWSNAAEAWLIGLLRHDTSAVRTRACEALGRIGTVVAVEPIYEARARDRGLRYAAAVAMNKIQARLGDVDAGRLSLSTPNEAEGALSLDGGRGHVSLGESEPET